MNFFDKWAERLYGETDFGRSVATSVAGILGLIVYLLVADWVVAVFTTVIVFPVVRLFATNHHKKLLKRSRRQAEIDDANHLYNSLSDEEKIIVMAFVNEGGSVLTWGQINNLKLPSAAMESLINREIISSSMTADGLTETFVLDESIFNIGVRARKAKKKSNSF